MIEYNAKNVDMYRQALLCTGQYYKIESINVNQGVPFKLTDSIIISFVIKNVGRWPKSESSDLDGYEPGNFINYKITEETKSLGNSLF